MPTALGVGELIWISDPQDVWKAAEIISVGETEYDVKTEDGQCVKLGRDDAYHLRSPDTYGDQGLELADDLTQLVHLHEASLLHSLHMRFDVDLVYTYAGPVLIAMNPFKKLPDLYSDDVMRAYADSATMPTEPHVYAISSRAFESMCTLMENQTVLISGESGAGKTETTKFVMKFVTSFTSSRPTAGKTLISLQSTLEGTETKILSSNPLLEAFGNAKTTRNSNSSRFGKYIQLQFEPNEDMVIRGAHIQTYLLEKVRITDQAEGERNYHVLYYICAAAARQGEEYNFPSVIESDMKLTLRLRGLGPYSDYAYLTKSTCSELQGVDDVEEFERLVQAMILTGIDVDEINSIFSVLIACLHLGNVKFEPARDEEETQVQGSTKKSLRLACDHLGIADDDLERMFVTRDIKVGADTFVANVKVHEAAYACDALAKRLYSHLFVYIVDQVNRRINRQATMGALSKFLGVLDIFGFECFKVNSLEQLCINYANEILQALFNNYIFKVEQQLYKREGLPWEVMDFPDNSAIVNLMTQRGMGIFSALDEECKLLKGTEKALCAKLWKLHDQHPNFRYKRNKPTSFMILHYAGPVDYLADGFIDKNKDSLSDKLVDLLREADSQTVRSIADSPAQASAASPRAAIHSSRGLAGSRSPAARLGDSPLLATPRSPLSSLARRTVSISNPSVWASELSLGNESDGRRASARVASKTLRSAPTTVASQFKMQLDDLMENIQQTQPSFIRCLKATTSSKPDTFERAYVAELLRYQGVLEVVAIMRSGFAVRISHNEWYMDFRSVTPDRVRREAQLAPTIRERVKIMLDAMAQAVTQKLSSDIDLKESYFVGHTLVLFRQNAFNTFRSYRSFALSGSATKIQALYRGRHQQKKYVFIQMAVLTIQALARGMLARKLVRALRFDRELKHRFRSCKARVIQRFYRKKIHLRRIAAIKIQKVWRMREQRWRYRDLVIGTATMQRLVRVKLDVAKARDMISREQQGVPLTDVDATTLEDSRIEDQPTINIQSEVQVASVKSVASHQELVTKLANAEMEIQRLRTLLDQKDAELKNRLRTDESILRTVDEKSQAHVANTQDKMVNFSEFRVKTHTISGVTRETDIQIVGKSKVGKTAMLSDFLRAMPERITVQNAAFVHHRFPLQRVASTASGSVKRRATFTIADCSGEPHFAVAVNSWMKQAKWVFAVYDCRDHASFEVAAALVTDALDAGAKAILIGNTFARGSQAQQHSSNNVLLIAKLARQFAAKSKARLQETFRLSEVLASLRKIDKAEEKKQLSKEVNKAALLWRIPKLAMNWRMLLRRKSTVSLDIEKGMFLRPSWETTQSDENSPSSGTCRVDTVVTFPKMHASMDQLCPFADLRDFADHGTITCMCFGNEVKQGAVAKEHSSYLLACGSSTGYIIVYAIHRTEAELNDAVLGLTGEIPAGEAADAPPTIIMSCAGHQGSVTSIFFVDDFRVATASKDCTIIIWDILTGTARDRIEDSSAILCATLIPHLKRYITANALHVVRSVSLVGTGSGVQNVKFNKEILCMCVYVDRASVITGTAIGILLILRCGDTQMKFKFQHRFTQQAVTCLTVEPSAGDRSALLFVSAKDSSVTIVSCHNGEDGYLSNLIVLHRVTTTHSTLRMEHCVTQLGGGFLVTGGEDKLIRVFNLQDFKHAPLKLHDAAVVAVQCNIHGSVLASADVTGRLRLTRRMVEFGARALVFPHKDTLNTTPSHWSSELQGHQATIPLPFTTEK
eukprot:GEMP01000682.1.p1 GENE.GEMP01000682.1~~GEMP01000682.1.p1  ORF type:complete len:1744 (+),score=360.23 GEMP01000682.1:121-5352(+)